MACEKNNEDILEITRKIAKKYGVTLQVEKVHNTNEIDVKFSYESTITLNSFIAELYLSTGIILMVTNNKSDSNKRKLYA
jgi:hypothetical protein